ncbi:MAG: tetraacyldisaccharide 4'-kinase [Chlamydiales bacterium]|nr:tetraacyldisaccharide 4'-kinase [Chlamydiales bacterium]
MRRLHTLEVWAESVMRGQRGGICASCFRMAMTPFSWVYGAAVKWRQVEGVKVSVPVISVGNVVCGGTGKTDVVTLLAKALPGKVGILSRGYKGAARGPLLVHNESASVCGDEPRMLADRLPNALVVVGRDRVAGARLAIEKGATCLIMDDGMQHRRLARDFEIGVVDGSNPLGGNHFLPKGLLRDDPKRLQKADLVVVTGKKIDLSFQPPVVRLRAEIEGIFTLKGEKIETLQGIAVALFCAIGNPSRFVKTVEGLGANVKEKLFLPDHAKVEERQLRELFVKSGAKYLVCTEKDRVKLRESALPIVWIKRRLLVDENLVAWQTLLQSIGKKL